MPLFVLKRRIGVWWSKPKNRAITAILALVVACGIQYWIVNRPVPVDVDARKYTPALARLKQEELVIEDPVIDNSRILLSLDGKTNEFIDLHFDKARLTKETIDQFRDMIDQHHDKPNLPPAELETVDFMIEDFEQVFEETANPARKKLPATPDIDQDDTQGKEDGTCLAFVKAEVGAESKLPTRVRFYQLISSGSTRDFYLTVDADLLVSLKISPLLNNRKPGVRWTPGCGKLLRVGKWEWHHSGLWEIKVFAPANSALHFTLLQHKPGSLWRDPTDLFQPFVFGSKPLQAQAISINPLKINESSKHSSAVFRATAANEEYLKVNALNLNAEQIQLDFSGSAWVQSHGEHVTGRYADYWNEYPIYQVIHNSAIVALVGWVAMALRGVIKGRREERSA